MESAGLWAPMLAGAIGGFFKGGPGEKAAGFPGEKYGFTTDAPSDRDPLAMGLMREGLGDLRRLAAKTTQFMTQPVVLPSAEVQPLPMFKGGGMFLDVGAPTLDVATRFPEVLWRPGVNWGVRKGTGPEPTPFYEGAGRDVHRLSPPPRLRPEQFPKFGAGYGGMQEMQNALALVGIPLEAQEARTADIVSSTARKSLPYYEV